MRTLITLFAFGLLFAAAPAYAGQAEVRDVAMSNNCTPKKIEVYKQNLGGDADSVYRVTCTIPKLVGPADADAPKPPDALLVGCTQNLCEMLRPLQTSAISRPIRVKGNIPDLPVLP
jgi:hypothetical protein